MNARKKASYVFLFLVLCACRQKTEYHTAALPAITTAADIPGNLPENKPAKSRKMVSAEAIIARKQVPILCYHQLRDWKPTDSKRAKDYIVPEASFVEQMK